MCRAVTRILALGKVVLTPFLIAGCVPLEPLPGSPFAFGVLGDVPYTESEVRRLDALIGRINGHELAFVVHVGDLGRTTTAQACGDAWLEARRRQLARLRAPVIVLPGDNDWSECVKRGLDPQARLAAWRRLFCTDGLALALERQPGHCENVRWYASDMAFIGLNVPGGGAPDLADTRMAATLEWLDESLAATEQRLARRVFVFMHADPRFERVGTNDAYARLRAVLTTHAGWIGDSLVLVHGDTHVYRDDVPRPGLRRLEPWGSPFVSWMRVAPNGALSVSSGW